MLNMTPEEREGERGSKAIALLVTSRQPGQSIWKKDKCAFDHEDVC